MRNRGGSSPNKTNPAHVNVHPVSYDGVMANFLARPPRSIQSQQAFTSNHQDTHSTKIRSSLASMRPSAGQAAAASIVLRASALVPLLLLPPGRLLLASSRRSLTTSSSAAPAAQQGGDQPQQREQEKNTGQVADQNVRRRRRRRRGQQPEFDGGPTREEAVVALPGRVNFTHACARFDPRTPWTLHILVRLTTDRLPLLPPQTKQSRKQAGGPTCAKR